MTNTAPTLRSITDKKIGPDPSWYADEYGLDALAMTAGLVMFSRANDDHHYVGGVEKALRELWPHCQITTGFRAGITSRLRLNGFAPIQVAQYRGWSVPATWQGWKDAEPRRSPGIEENPHGEQAGPVVVRRVKPRATIEAVAPAGQAPTLRRRKHEYAAPIPKRQAILNALANGGLSTMEIRTATGLTEGEVHVGMEFLRDRGLVAYAREKKARGGGKWFPTWKGAPPIPANYNVAKSDLPHVSQPTPEPKPEPIVRAIPGQAPNMVRVLVGDRVVRARHVHDDLYEEVR